MNLQPAFVGRDTLWRISVKNYNDRRESQLNSRLVAHISGMSSSEWVTSADQSQNCMSALGDA